MNYDFHTLRGDVFGGLTATVVALPFALAFGVASGLGAAAGLYGAIAVGFFASVFGGTRSLISGPTGPMAVAMAVIVTTHATNLTEALTVVVMGGLLQVLLGLLRIGRFVAYTPYVVISGFMSGIGIIIMLIQSLPFLGAPAAPGGPMGIGALPEAVGNVNSSAFAIAAVTLAVGVLWPRRLTRFLPAPLMALMVGTLLGVVWLSDVPVIGPVPTGLPSFQLALPSASFLARALEPALILALLGSIDSLLTSLVADSLTGMRHDPNRELVGQGYRQHGCGTVRGLTWCWGYHGHCDQHTRRRAHFPVSGALCAVLLLALVMGLGRYVEPIPHAVLAGILMKVGWDIIDWRLLARVHRIQRTHLLVMLATLSLTVFVDLVTAVGIGLIAAGMANAQELEGLELDSVVSVPLLDQTFFSAPDAAEEDPFSARVGLVAIRGRLTVASSNKLVGVISADIKDHEVVIFDFSEAAYLDDSAAMVIEQLMDVATGEQTEVIIMGLSGSVENTLQTLAILQRVPPEHVVETLDEARPVAKALLDG